MRESGDALVDGLGITTGMKVLDLGCGDGTTALPGGAGAAPTCSASTSRGTWSRPGTRRARAEGLTNCQFQEGDATNLSGLADQRFDLVVSIFGAMFAPKPFDVAKEMVRVTQARRPDRDGQLDSQRPDARRADPEDQLRLLAAAARGLRQPDDVGHREPRDRALRRRGHSRERIAFARDTFIVRLSAAAAGVRRGRSGTTTGRR